MGPETLELYGDDIRHIGMRYGDLRREQGLTQRDVAELACRTQSRVSDLETGHCDPRLSTMIRMAEALGYEFQVRLVQRRSNDGPTAQ